MKVIKNTLLIIVLTVGGVQAKIYNFCELKNNTKLVVGDVLDCTCAIETSAGSLSGSMSAPSGSEAPASFSNGALFKPFGFSSPNMPGAPMFASTFIVAPNEVLMHDVTTKVTVAGNTVKISVAPFSNDATYEYNLEQFYSIAQSALSPYDAPEMNMILPACAQFSTKPRISFSEYPNLSTREGYWGPGGRVPTPVMYGIAFKPTSDRRFVNVVLTCRRFAPEAPTAQ